MPDVIVTAAPPPSGPPNPLLGATPGDTFDNAMRGHAQEAGESDANSAAAKPTEKAADTKDAAAAAKSTIPESLLKPKEAAVDPNKPKFTPEEIHAALNERPPGQIKKDDFARAQEASRFRIAQIQAELDTIRTERDAFKSNAGKPDPETAQELTELREQLKHARTTLEQEAYQRTPEFQERFTAREQNIRAQAENVLKAAGVDTALLETVLHGAGRQRFGPLTDVDLTDAERSHLHSLVAQYDLLQPEKKAALEQSHERMTRAQQERQSQQESEKRQRIAEEAHTFEAVQKEMTATLDAFQKAEGDDETSKTWNSEIDKLQADIVKFLNGDGDFKKFAEITFQGFAYNQQKRLTDAWKARAESQAEELARIKAASPSAAGANGQRQRDAGQHDFTGLTSWDELVGRK